MGSCIWYESFGAFDMNILAENYLLVSSLPLGRVKNESHISEDANFILFTFHVNILSEDPYYISVYEHHNFSPSIFPLSIDLSALCHFN